MATRPLAEHLRNAVAGLAINQSELVSDCLRTYATQENPLFEDIRKLATQQTETFAAQCLATAGIGTMRSLSDMVAPYSSLMDIVNESVRGLAATLESDALRVIAAGAIQTTHDAVLASVRCYGEVFDSKYDLHRPLMKGLHDKAAAPLNRSQEMFRELTDHDRYFPLKRTPGEPLRFRSPNYAELKIDAIERDETEKRAGLATGERLNMYLVTGSGMFLVRGSQSFTAKDGTYIEVEVFDGERFQAVSLHYEHVVLYYETVDGNDKPETIH
jgi:hypothetical protein